MPEKIQDAMMMPMKIEDDHGRHRLSQGLLHALHQIVKLVAQRGGYQAGKGQRDEQDDVDVKSQDYDA